MSGSLDLDAYLDRIGWSGSVAPSYDTLAGLLRAHVAAIPFENLDVLLRRPIRLDLSAIEAKLVRGGRGGYCFEHATLFGAVLGRLGFQPVPHAARVVLFAPRHESPRTHMFLTVPVDGRRFIVDPGFGFFGCRAPLPLEHGAEVRVEHETHWLHRDGDLWVLRVQSADKPPSDAWVSTLETENPVDFEVANHFIATHPASPFVNRIMMSAVTGSGRVNVMNRDVSLLRGDQRRTSQLTDRSALRALLARHFGFDLPEIDGLRVPSIPEWA